MFRQLSGRPADADGQRGQNLDAAVAVARDLKV
jgi:hypothetical protein